MCFHLYLHNELISYGDDACQDEDLLCPMKLPALTQDGQKNQTSTKMRLSMYKLKLQS